MASGYHNSDAICNFKKLFFLNEKTEAILLPI